MNGAVKSVLIAGPPASGKTTVIRELCHSISDRGYNVCILDERGEIAGIGNNRFDVGVCTDIYSLKKKAEAADMALRLMTPDVIAFDEIADDSMILNKCVSCGAKIFCTIHAENMKDVYYRTDLLNIDRSVFDFIAVLRNNRTGEIEQLWERSGYNSA